MAETAKRKNPEIWERAKAKAMRKMGGKWSGRAAQLAVKYYKDMGGKYEGPKKETSLSRWTDQDWDYVGDDSLSSGQKAAGSRAKNKATKGGKGKASYTEAERKAVRRATKK